MSSESLYQTFPSEPDGSGNLDTPPPSYEAATGSQYEPLSLPRAAAGICIVSHRPKNIRHACFRDVPIVITCPGCNRTNTTRVEHVIGMNNHLTALLLCCMGFVCCACLPYCTDCCSNTNHYCKFCGLKLGSSESM